MREIKERRRRKESEEVVTIKIQKGDRGRNKKNKVKEGEETRGKETWPG